MVKKLIVGLCLLTGVTHAQIGPAGTIQKDNTTKIVRGNFGTNGLDSILVTNGAGVNGYVPVYNSSLKKSNWVNPSSFSPTLSTLTLGFGLLGTSYNGSAPVTAKVDSGTFATLANLGNYVKQTRTVAGFPLNTNVTLAALTAGYGITSGGTYTGATARTFLIDTTLLQTVANFKPMGNTFWASKTAPFTITTPNTVANANGATISSGVFRLNKVSATSPGILTTGTDTIAGDKLFNGRISTPSGISVTGGSASTFSSAVTMNGGLTIASGALGVTNNAVINGILSTAGTPGKFRIYNNLSYAEIQGQSTTNRTVKFQNKSYTIADSADLANSSITIGSTNIALGGTATTLAGLSSVTSTTFVGALTGNATSANSVVSTSGGNVSFSGDVTNHTYGLPGTNSFIYTSTAGSITSAQVLASLTDETGNGSAVFSTSATLVAPALGTPTALVGTNITGTAAGLTAGNVTTNANLTGVITSVGNATSIASQTGTGTTFVTAAGPTITGTLTYTTLAGAGSSSIATLNTSAGSVTTTLNLRNGGQAVGTGVGIGFNAGAAGTNSGIFKYVQTGATTTRDGDFVMQPTLSGTLTDMFRFASTGTITTNITSGSILSALSATTSGVFLNFANTSGTFVAGVESSAGGAIITGDTGYDAAIRGISGISFSGNNGANLHLRLTSTGGLTLSTAGKINITEGTNGSAGQTTLVAGTKAITITGITTATRAFVTLVTAANTSLTTTYQAVCTANTLTIQSNIAAGTINIADTSTLNYWVEN